MTKARVEGERPEITYVYDALGAVPYYCPGGQSRQDKGQNVLRCSRQLRR